MSLVGRRLQRVWRRRLAAGRWRSRSRPRGRPTLRSTASARTHPLQGRSFCTARAVAVIALRRCAAPLLVQAHAPGAGADLADADRRGRARVWWYLVGHVAPRGVVGQMVPRAGNEAIAEPHRLGGAGRWRGSAMRAAGLRLPATVKRYQYQRPGASLGPRRHAVTPASASVCGRAASGGDVLELLDRAPQPSVPTVTRSGGRSPVVPRPEHDV